MLSKNLSWSRSVLPTMHYTTSFPKCNYFWENFKAKSLQQEGFATCRCPQPQKTEKPTFPGFSVFAYFRALQLTLICAGGSLRCIFRR